MLHYNKIIGLTAAVILVLTGCYKDKTVSVDAPVVTKTVSFSQDLVPLFSKSCAFSGCHSTGGQAPNLLAANAYNALIIGNYITKTSPASSIIYLKLTGKKGTPMPVTGVNPDYAALVLAWIKQGGNNN